MKSGLVVGIDVKAERVVFVFVFFEEGVGVIFAQFFIDFDVVGLGNVVARFFGVGFLERNDLGRGDVFNLVVELVVNRLDGLGLGGRRLGRHRSLLEKGARIALAGIGRDNRIEVEIVELFTRIRVGPLGAAVGTGHRCSSWMGFGGRFRPVFGQSGYEQSRPLSNRKCGELLPGPTG